MGDHMSGLPAFRRFNRNGSVVSIAKSYKLVGAYTTSYGYFGLVCKYSIVIIGVGIGGAGGPTKCHKTMT